MTDHAQTMLADKLERLCCAETEKQFFDCITDNIDTIFAALRASAPVAVRKLIEECELAARGPVYKEKYNGYDGHNWSRDSDYGRGRHAAADAIASLILPSDSPGSAIRREATAPEPGWLAPALDKAAARASEMPDWMTRAHQPQGGDALAKAREALKPFALNPGAVSLSKALGHISREHLLAAKDALSALEAAPLDPLPTDKYAVDDPWYRPEVSPFPSTHRSPPVLPGSRKSGEADPPVRADCAGGETDSSTDGKTNEDYVREYRNQPDNGSFDPPDGKWP